MRIVTKYVISVIAGLWVLALIFFLIMPLGDIMVIGSFSPFRLTALSQANDYYGIVSAFITFIVGGLGLLLGYFYYKDRNRHDLETKRLSERLKRLEILLSGLRSYDECVRSVLMRLCDSDQALGHKRLLVRTYYYQLYAMLEAGDTLFGLSNDELGTIISLFSFVDTSHEIMEASKVAVDAADIFAIEGEYSRRLVVALRACTLCMARTDATPT